MVHTRMPPSHDKSPSPQRWPLSILQILTRKRKVQLECVGVCARAFGLCHVSIVANFPEGDSGTFTRA